MNLSRVIFYLVKVGLLIAAAIWLAERPGQLTLDWFHHRIEMPVGLAIGLLALCFLVLLGLWNLWRFLRRAPREFSLYRQNRRRTKGHRALTQGLLAIAAGEANAARAHAKTAKNLLGEASLPLWLAAQAAQLTGDDEHAARYFEALAKEKETALLGWRGLTHLALKRKDEIAALHFSEKALALSPHAHWAAEIAYRLELKASKFDEAEASLKTLIRAKSGSAQSSGAMGVEKSAERRRAALLTERARSILAEDSGSDRLDDSLRFSREAVKLASAFAPARAVLAQSLMRKAKMKEAARLIEQAWDEAPHWSLGRILLLAWSDLEPLDRARRAAALADRQPHHPASHRLAAEAALSAKLWGEARHHLGLLADEERAMGGLTQDLCRLMARLESVERHNAPLERQWLDRATFARPNPEWCCAQCGAISIGGSEAGGWQLLCHACDGVDSMEWKSPTMPPHAAMEEWRFSNGDEKSDESSSFAFSIGRGSADKKDPRSTASDPLSGKSKDKDQDKGTGGKASSSSSVDAARLVN